MKSKITTIRLSERRKGKTDWKRAKAIAEDPDTEEATPEMWARAVVWRPAVPKDPITVRVDRDILKWLRRQGRGYQTRINAILRAYYEAHRP